MLIRQSILEGIRRGEVTLAFRRWRRQPPANGSTVTTAVGLLRLEGVRAIEEADITPDDLIRAGASSWAELAAALAPDGILYRMEIRLIGDDPRVALRERRLVDDADGQAVIARLRSMDRRSSCPWTRGLLEIVAAQPAVLAATLAAQVDVDRDVLKRRMRALKALGLTESLDVGYRLSPRGRDVLDLLKHEA